MAKLPSETRPPIQGALLQEHVQALLLLNPVCYRVPNVPTAKIVLVHILYVSQYYAPEIGAPAARASELARRWVQMGHDVTVLTGFPNHPTGVIPAEYRRVFYHLRSHERVDGVHLERTWLLPLPNARWWERVANYGSFCASAALRGTFLSKPDVVIATSPQLLVGLSGWWISRRHNVPFVFEVRDLWPESLEAVGAGGSGSLLYRSLAAIVRFLYRSADRIVVVSEAFRTHLIEKHAVHPSKIHFVPNGVETTLFRPSAASSDLRRSLGLECKTVVSYIGTMGMAHGLECLLEAAKTLQNVAPHVTFMLVGEGAEKNQLQAQAQRLYLTNVRFVGQVSRERVPEYIALSDTCLVLLKQREIFQTVIPTKMLEFMSCACPVILGVEGEARRILTQANAGVCVPPENPQALSDAILRLSRDEDMRKSLGMNGRAYIERNLSRQRSAEVYVELLEELLRRTPTSLAVAA